MQEIVPPGGALPSEGAIPTEGAEPSKGVLQPGSTVQFSACKRDKARVRTNFKPSKVTVRFKDIDANIPRFTDLSTSGLRKFQCLANKHPKVVDGNYICNLRTSYSNPSMILAFISKTY